MSELAQIEPTELKPVAPTTPATLLQLAVEQGADLDRLEKLMALQQNWEANEARKAFASAMTGFRADCPEIDKNAKGHNSKYATLAHTISLIKEPLSKHGLSHNWKTEQTEDLISVTCCVTHQLGHQECTSMNALSDTSGSKNAIQALGSTVTYLQRYTLYAILGLASASEDDDDDGAATGKVKTVIDVTNEWIKRNEVIREYLPSICDLKDRLADGDLLAAAEVYLGFSDDLLGALRVAASKGGMFDIKEVKLMTGNEWFAAKNAITGHVPNLKD